MNLTSTVRSSFAQAGALASTGGAGGTGTTGDALALSTAGSTGTGTSTSGPGGYPFASTGIPMTGGVEGVRFTAFIQSGSTGGGAGTSGIATIQAYAAQSSTSAPTGWVALKDAYCIGYSSASFALQLDVYRPKLPAGFTALGAIVQVPSSSAFLLGVLADAYGIKTIPVSNSTALNTAGGTQFGALAVVAADPTT